MIVYSNWWHRFWYFPLFIGPRIQSCYLLAMLKAIYTSYFLPWDVVSLYLGIIFGNFSMKRISANGFVGSRRRAILLTDIHFIVLLAKKWPFLDFAAVLCIMNTLPITVLFVFSIRQLCFWKWGKVHPLLTSQMSWVCTSHVCSRIGRLGGAC